MADRLLTADDAGPAPRAIGWRERLRGLPWWASVGLVFLASRIVTTAILLVDAAVQSPNSFSPESSPAYWQFATYWDGVWYARIASVGYPSVLPIDASGNVTENAWAFLPAWPGLVKAISTVTTVPYEFTAIGLSVLFSFGTALLFYRILARRISGSDALYAVALFSFGPTSTILQVGYAESMLMLLVAAVILLVVERRYLLTLPLIVIADFTRPTGIALGLFLAAHLVLRWRARMREPLRLEEVASISVAGATAAITTVAWPVIAAVVTGVPGAYTRTELAWRSGWIGQGDLVPFSPWFLGADWWLKFLSLPEPAAAVLGSVLVVGAAAGLGIALTSRAVARRLEPEPRLWSAAYIVYLLAVFFPQTSTLRILMPAFPLLGAVQPRSRALRGAILAALVPLQILWVAVCWWIAPNDWSPP